MIPSTALFALLVPLAQAEAPAPATGRVAEVQIVGMRRVEEAVFLEAIDLGAGDELTPDAVEADIRSLWRTGFVDDVVVH